MTTINIKGKQFQVDPEYLDQIKPYTWCLKEGRYGQTRLPSRLSCSGQSESMSLHQLVMNIHHCIALGDSTYAAYGFVIDHINHDTFDNRIVNLRYLPAKLNSSSQSQTKTSSRYLGVSWLKKLSKWHVKYRHNNKLCHLGLFLDELKAAKAYDAKIIELGLQDIRILNFP